ncbi:MAG: ribosome biogenesis GTPase Der [Candidatus Parcubacteria bacterium]|nr:ribosome biogenesis GTPase Der [Candidatus Parcubacteria bacterium]
MKKYPRVIIFGRANTGKSTLFNRLIEQSKSLTSPLAGTTRDFNVGQVYWQGYNFELIDTGGIDTILPKKKLKNLAPKLNLDFAVEIIRKTQQVLKEADLIVFVVDTQVGVLAQDRELKRSLEKLLPAKPIILVANKMDSINRQPQTTEFFKLGLGAPVCISAKNGLGTGDLLDAITETLVNKHLLKKGEKPEKEKALKITMVGKPNVGKSSLLNAILGEERVIVSPIPFTTRESIDIELEYNNQKIILVDTAGVRKQSKVNVGLEHTSVKRSLENARHSDICLLILDISEPISVQDNKLSDVLIKSKASIIIVANKWDLIVDKDDKTQNNFTKYIYRYFPYLTWAPIIFVSAKTQKGTQNVLDLALEVYKKRQIQIKDKPLDTFLKKTIKRHRPSRSKGFTHPFLFGLTQVKTNPPIFEIKLRKQDQLNQSYLRYLENSLRTEFDLIGTPIEINLKDS